MSSFAVVTLTAFLGAVSAQLTSNCNPLKTSCPANNALSSSNLDTNFQSGASNQWRTVEGTTLSYDGNGAQFTVASAAQAPTIETDFYILFGYVEATVRAAPGAGIVSSMVLASDVLDEIDWEWLGGRGGEVQTNYFGKGDDSTFDRGTVVPLSIDATTTFHTYAVNWTPTTTQWIIDGNVVRTLNFADAKGGSRYPQTPCRVRFGNWAAGASPNEGTVTWSGGPTDFSQGPFNMYVKDVKITNYNPADSYEYRDMSGSFESINIVNPKGDGAIPAPNTPASSSSAAPVTTTTTATTTTESSITTTTTTTTTTSPKPTTTSSRSEDVLDATTKIVGAADPTTTGSSDRNSTSIRTATTSTSRSASSSTLAGAATSPTIGPNGAVHVTAISTALTGLMIAMLGATSFIF